MKRLLKKLFIGGEWHIAYKKKSSNKYQSIDLPQGIWAADPMLFEHKKVHYLFAEIYEEKEKRAGIGYFVFENDTPIYKGLIIKNEYHMSYPCVFRYKDRIFMIPETSANNSLELYEAVSFPNEWRKKQVILDKCNYVDTTVYVNEDRIYLLTYSKNNSHWDLDVFLYDLDNNSVRLIYNTIFEKNTGRPAGYLFERENIIYRPAQNSSRKYGENLLFYRIQSFDPYKETEEYKIAISDLNLTKKAERIHTYSEDSEYDVVDLFNEKFEFFHAIEIYKRSHSRRRKK